MQRIGPQATRGGGKPAGASSPSGIRRDARRYDTSMSKRQSSTRLALGAFLLVAFFPWPAAISQAARPNVVVLVLDQLRADRLHSYGNPRLTSPNIDRLANNGVLFSHFNTVAPWTSPSFGSLHTSLYPSQHGVTLFWRPGMPLIDKDKPTMAEQLQKSGYYTAAFVDNSLAGYPLTGSGFDEYHAGGAAAQDITNRVSAGAAAIYKAPSTTQQVLNWLDVHHAESQPFFLYVHFIEPHSPYNPPQQDDLFKSDEYPNLSDDGYDLVRGGLLRLAMTGDEKAVDRLYQLYDGKIHFVDRYVGQILDRLQSLQLDGNTYILLTSDHGELLYSHPDDFLTFDHRSLYDAVLHIPLIVAGPGIPHGKIVDALASNIDTAPTILALAGAPPISDAEGHALTPLIQGKAVAVNHYLFAEEDTEIPERSVRNMRYKLIRNLWTGEQQLFDLQSDPGELRNVAGENSATVGQLAAQLDAWMKANQPSPSVQMRRWRIYTQPDNIVTIDDMTIGGRFLLTQRQSWHSNQDPGAGAYNGACFWTTGGDGARTAVWRNDNPLIGKYLVSVYFGDPNVGNLATNAPFRVVTKHGSTTVQVNLQQGAGEWKLLGTFEDPRFVELSNAANGVVVADAVRFERIEERASN